MLANLLKFRHRASEKEQSRDHTRKTSSAFKTVKTTFFKTNPFILFVQSNGLRLANWENAKKPNPPKLSPTPQAPNSRKKAMK
ncbi:hypothetical protein Y1Q_0000739 [Alligator mississippiensis]|uniref:Uncharacterized protein n=1 Tax=Alligator mississippiensis TaxID=8496 RepID=A0A151MCA7_ALLMI|nr:hypothetical protein Y1Q_0000739 [Alligator mississippiensis]